MMRLEHLSKKSEEPSVTPPLNDEFCPLLPHVNRPSRFSSYLISMTNEMHNAGISLY